MMDFVQEAPAYYKDLSMRLCKILDNVGASESCRAKWKRTGSINEMLLSVLSRFIHEDTRTAYQFGSSIEGTTTNGLWSDADYLVCKDTIDIVQDIPADPTEDKLCFLMVRDEETKPGYTKLQRLFNNVPQTAMDNIGVFVTDKVDSKGRLVVCRSLAFNVHGPANTYSAKHRYPDQDIVDAYKCQTWPKCADRWFTRTRPFQWPSAEQMDQMRTFGFFLVPVGHPHSRERDKEWRISLSLQERLLMFNLNPTQFKCYVLLKMIKKETIFSLLARESFSSYHLKTCLFYLIEKTPACVWAPENLLACVQECLKCLLQWVINGECPNYFIPEENMFERRFDRELRLKVQYILQKLLSANFSFVLYIKCDDIGRQLRDACLERPRILASNLCTGLITIRTYHSDLEIAAYVSYNLLNKCISSDPEACIAALLKIMAEVSKIKTISVHTTEEAKTTTSLLLPYLELSLISNICVRQAIKSGKQEHFSEPMMNILHQTKWQDLTESLDSFSPKLKQAMFLYILGHYKSSLDILNSLESMYGSTFVSVCNCQNIPLITSGDVVDVVERMKISKEAYMKSFIAFCVMFLPSETALIPTVLAYEMIRSVHMPRGSRNEKHDFWYDWAVLDSKFMLYFMLYLNHQKLSMRRHAEADISKMHRVFRTDENLGHKESDLNVLGWVYEQEGCVNIALACFRASLMLKKTHNAAFWHICTAINRLINRLPARQRDIVQ